MILKEQYIREDKLNNTGFCQCLKLHTHAQNLYTYPAAHMDALSLSLSFSLSLCHMHTHTHGLLCLQKAGTNDRLCVVCVLTQLPPGHTLPTQQKTALCVSLSLSLLLSVYLSLSCSRCLPTFFSLWRIELFCCALLYILPTVYIFLAPDNRYMSTAVGVFFLADTSHSHFPVNGAIKTAHKKRHLNANMVNIEP